MPNPSVPTRQLREQPDLEQLKRQAKELLASFLAGEPDAVAEVNIHVSGADPTTFALHDAQLAIARAYGFPSWPRLKAHVDGVNVGRLSAAVKAGDLAAVRAILKAAPDLVHMDMAGNNEHRALHYAVLERQPELVRVLMEAGADARKGIYPHRDATSAYTIATERGYSELVAIMDEEEQARREAMSCPNATVSPVQDELNAAIRAGKAEVVTGILDREPTLVKACDREGRSPLHVAASVLNDEIVALLLERGADVKRKSMAEETPLDSAVRAVDFRREGSLARFPAVAQRLRWHGAELNALAAAGLGDIDRLRELHREDPRSVADPALMLLTVAVKHERIDTLRALLDLGLGPDERKRVGGLEETVYSWGEPLWLCAADKQYAMAELLLERGADPNGAVYASGSAVFQAFGKRDEKMKDLLISRGGRPDAPTIGLYRETALGRRVLRESGREPWEQHACSGKTVAEQMLWGAACGGDAELVRLSLEQVDWPREDGRWFNIMEQPLRFWNHGGRHRAKSEAMDRSTYATCLGLILERCDANIVGRFGRRIVHDVATCGVPEQATLGRLVLDAGGRWDVRDDLLRSTPLGWACRWGCEAMVALLLERWAPANEPDAQPWATPLAWAKKMGHAAIERRLREAGAE